MEGTTCGSELLCVPAWDAWELLKNRFSAAADEADEPDMTFAGGGAGRGTPTENLVGLVKSYARLVRFRSPSSAASTSVRVLVRFGSGAVCVRDLNSGSGLPGTLAAR